MGGTIKKEVIDLHTDYNAGEEKIIKAFLPDFDVTWASSRIAYNTKLSLYFFKPLPHISELFGFESEIAFIINKYDTVQPRTLQAAEQILRDSPARGRVDPAIYLIYSRDSNSKQNIQNQLALNDHSRIPVVFCEQNIIEALRDSWKIRNIIIEQIYSKNLFDSKLPVENDLFFFGREILITDYLHALRQSQNRGLFGLRKTGKTSIMFKIQRMLEKEGKACIIYLDCKNPDVRSLSWSDLLHDICTRICNHYRIKQKLPSSPIAALAQIMKQIDQNSFIGLIFDEIEYISHIASLDPHWKKDFIPFWQAIWSLQSQYRKLSTIIVGVNPSVVEIDLVDGIQNPMFGIFQTEYLKGFTVDELSQMTRFFGKRMGLKFDRSAVDYLVKRYGGHPLLSRLACGYIHNSALQENIQRPYIITDRTLISTEQQREHDLVFYCGHIISELKLFYKDEYDMLEILAEGDINGFMALQDEEEYIRHLNGYGLISRTPSGKPIITIPVLEEYMAKDIAKRNKCILKKYIIAPHMRANWVSTKCKNIIDELRLLEKYVNQSTRRKIFGDKSFAEPEKFLVVGEVKTQDEFICFINTCNKCFIERIEEYGKSCGCAKYFWKEFKTDYPDLWYAFCRIKIYRNKELHLELNAGCQKLLEEYLLEDIEGKKPSQIEDVWFILQQRCLDGIFLGIQCELNSFMD